MFSAFLSPRWCCFGKPSHVSPPQTCVDAHEGNAWVSGDVWVRAPVRICAGTKWSRAVR